VEVLRHHYSGREEGLKVVRRNEGLEESPGQKEPGWIEEHPSCMRGH
jgi:hypothetical protein